MQRSYFVDTWFFVALIDRFDAHHSRTRNLRPMIENATLVTHDAVLTEVLAYFSGEGARLRAEATTAVRSALRNMTVLPADRPLFLAPLDRYAARPDKGYSLVDCMSMALMERRGMTHVLTNDHHFRQEGFVVVNDAP